MAGAGGRAGAIRDVFSDLTDTEVNQIWAEAYKIYLKGEKLFLNPAMEKTAREMQKEHSVIDERIGLIEEYLNTPVPETWDEMERQERADYFLNLIRFPDEKPVDGKIRNIISVAEIWCELFGRKPGEMTGHNTRDLHSIMRNLNGWEQAKSKIRFSHYGNLIGYKRLKPHGGS